jgi:hypothetical protein
MSGSDSLDALYTVLQQISGYLATLIVAVVAVIIDHRLTDRSSLNSAVDGLRSELEYNLGISQGIVEFSNQELGGASLMNEYPHFNTASFDFFRNAGHMARVGKDYQNKLGHAYYLMSVVDGLSRKRDEVSIGFAGLVNSRTMQPVSETMKQQIVKAEHDLVINDLQPAMNVLVKMSNKQVLQDSKSATQASRNQPSGTS